MPGIRKSTADASVESVSRSYPPCAALRSSSVLSNTFKYCDGAWVADGERLCEREPVGLGVVDCDALPEADEVLVTACPHVRAQKNAAASPRRGAGMLPEWTRGPNKNNNNEHDAGRVAP